MKKKTIIAIMMVFIAVFCITALDNPVKVKVTAVSFENVRLNITTKIENTEDNSPDQQFRFYFHDDPLLLQKAKGYQANALYALAMNKSVIVYYTSDGNQKLLEGFNVVR